MDPSQWIPMRLADASALDRLKGTPVNCLMSDAKLPGFETVSLANLPDSVVCRNDAVWPGIRAPGAGSGDAPAGPTGVPWVDSNGWLIRLTRALVPGKTVWVAFDPPKGTVVTADAWVLAVVDAEAYGGRWVISPGALDSFDPVTRALAFFERHKEWRSYQPVAVLGVVSDFTGPNEFAGGEVLNLLARRHQPYRILVKSRASQAMLAGLKAVLYVDQQPPEAELRRTLLDFAAAGGLLIVPPNFKAPEGVKVSADAHPRYRMYGRVAVAKEEVSDPYVLAADSHLLMSHRNDLVRVWNAASTNSYFLCSPDGKRALVEMINYATSPGEPISVWVMGAYRRARFLSLDGEATLKPMAQGQGTELHLPAFRVYAAVELE